MSDTKVLGGVGGRVDVGQAPGLICARGAVRPPSTRRVAAGGDAAEELHARAEHLSLRRGGPVALVEGQGHVSRQEPPLLREFDP